MNDRTLIEALSRWAAEEKLDLVGWVPVGPTPSWERYRVWVEKGYVAAMHYLSRPDAVFRRADPRRVLPEVRTILVVGVSYANHALPPLPRLHGRVARYVWGASPDGTDYHRWLLHRLKRLVRRLAEEVGAFPWRVYVDTGPILERAWAQAAGIGWIGKNACLVHPRFGSYLLLGVALLGVTLPPSPPSFFPTCGTCTRCMEACPTQAIVSPGVVDARRCLAYLTIEHRAPIPVELRSALGMQLFGCDMCQEVCPWNQRWLRGAPIADAPLASLALLPLLAMDEATFRARFRHTPIWRATAEGLARNAAVVLGNAHDPAARPYLERAALHHPSLLVREHAAWALAQL